MNIDVQTLQAENEKLNGRLKKAIQVFNQQKADIERLNTEKDNLITRINDLEKQVNDNAANDNKFFEQESEIQDLKDKLAAAEKSITEYDDMVSNLTEIRTNQEKAIAEYEATCKKQEGELNERQGKIVKQGEYIVKVTKALKGAIDKLSIYANIPE